MQNVSVGNLPISRILEGLPSALIAVTEDGTVRFVNRIALKVLACRVLLDGQIEEYIAPIDTLLTSGEGSSCESMHNERGIVPMCNTELELGLRANTVQTAEGRMYLIVFRDISKSIRLRQERDRLLRMVRV